MNSNTYTKGTTPAKPEILDKYNVVDTLEQNNKSVEDKKEISLMKYIANSIIEIDFISKFIRDIMDPVLKNNKTRVTQK